MEMNVTCTTNIQKTDSGINILFPNDNFIKSIHITNLNYPNLSPSVTSYHILYYLASGSLISLEICAM